MLAFFLRRLVQGIPVLFLISAIVFLVVYLIPGDPAAVILGHGATDENLKALRHEMGLDRPVVVRYGVWLEHVLRGDLGDSVLSKQPVWTLIGRAFPITAYLSIFALLIAILIAVPTGILSAMKRNSWIDLVCTTWAFLGVSIPSFWLAIVLIYVFGVKLAWFPLQGYVKPQEDFIQSIKTMILPAFTLGFFVSGPLMRYLRSSVLQTLAQEFVLVGRAKGLSERRVLFGHILRNSLIPFVTALGIYLGYLIGGAVVIENVFAMPGMGDLVVSAIGNRDFPVVQGVVLVVATSIVIINIGVDLIHSLLDPRIRISKGS
ncbi:MAG: ABC transporter permease [Thermomicrobiales bacterium]|nr:ABC transporter permease [Thermomicrobiales bacterium]